MSGPAPFYRKLLRETLAKKLGRNPRYSIRAFAKALDLDSGALSQILSGKRVPSVKQMDRMVERLGLEPKEQDEFLISVAKTKAALSPERMSPKLRNLLKENHRTIDPATHYDRELSTDAFRIIADWYHYAILEFTTVNGFQSHPAWIAKKLAISTTEATLAINRLLELGLLTRTPDGQLSKTEQQITTADKTLTSSAHRRRQKQVLEKSIQSLEHDPLDIRNHTAMTMAIDLEMLPKAKALIRQFSAELCVLLESGKKEKVYELSISLFPLQTGE